MNVTTDEQSDEALRGWAKWFRAAFEISPVCTGLTGPDGRLRLVNPAMSTVLGYSREELLQLTLDDITHPNDRARSNHAFRGLFRGGAVSYQIEKRYIHKDGSVIWSLLTVSAIHDSESRPVYALGQFLDITERRRAEAAWRESESTLHSLLKAAPMGIGLVRGRVFSWVNARMTEMLGYTEQELVGKSSRIVYPTDEEFERIGQVKYSQIRYSGMSEVETQFRHKDGSLIDVYLSSSATNPEDLSAGIIFAALDITERKRAEYALRISNHHLSVLNALLEISLADIPIKEQLERVLDKILTIPWLPLKSKGGIFLADQQSRSLIMTAQKNLPASIQSMCARVPYGECLCGQAAATRCTVHATQIEQGYRVRQENFIPLGHYSVPILSGNNVLGVMVLYLPDGHEGSEEEQAFLDAVANTIAGCIERNDAARVLRDREEMLRSITNAARDAIVLLDHNGKVAFWNNAAARIFGYRAEEALGQVLTDLIIPGEYKEAHQTGFGSFQSAGDGTVVGKTVELEALSKDGTEFSVELSLSAVQLGAKWNAVGVIRDITERKRAEVALRESEKRFHALYDDNPVMFFTVNVKGTVLSVNEFGAQQLGYRVKDMVGRPLTAFQPLDDLRSENEQLAVCFRDPDTVHHWESRKLRQDGTLRWVRKTVRVTEEADGIPTALIVCEDITEARQLSEQLSFQASHDALTGLVNRREFEQRLGRVLATARIQKTQHALCYLDLDQFKVINDTCGHVAGDQLLRQLGGLLQAHVRKRDTLARLGGDEFGVLMEHCSLQQAKRVANVLRAAIEQYRYAWENKSFGIGVSIGLVPINETSESIAGVLRAADSACFAAKDGGRNRVYIYQENDMALAKRHGEMQWVARINRALEEDRLKLNYQPIVPVSNGKPKGLHYELLIRMQDESGEMVPPGAFLPAAERYNLITKLDRWVVGAALRWFTQNPQHLECLHLCNINLSGQSIGEKEFLDFLIPQFEQAAVPAQKLCFEITETAAIANLISAANFIRALKAQGCRFALDDFGSGLSSFAYLKALPVDFIKIDGVFVKDIVDDPVDFTMVKAIQEIARVMGKQTIAEFVENQAILKKLRTIGVDYVQGYGIGRPQPVERLSG
jgi:diguanylate cyclase (GGDEF)-like protein/PAS domain S-box-containing protein